METQDSFSKGVWPGATNTVSPVDEAGQMPYRDDTGNATEENSALFSLIQTYWLLSVRVGGF